MGGWLSCYRNLKGEYLKVWGYLPKVMLHEPKGGNLILKYMIVCLLVMFAIIHDIELFSSIVMYLEFNNIVES